MAGGTVTISIPTAAPPERQSAARGWQAPLKACAPGPMLTAPPSCVASGHPYRGRRDRFCPVYGQGVCSARWAALGCDATSRHQSLNAKSGPDCNPNPPDFRSSSRSLCVIQAPIYQGFSFSSELLRVRSVAVLNHPTDQRHGSGKFRVGAFHSSQSCMSTPSVEAFVK